MTDAQQDTRAGGAERIGARVLCVECGRLKKPIGRDLPAGAGEWCTNCDCEFYQLEPRPDNLWPGESANWPGEPPETPDGS